MNYIYRFTSAELHENHEPAGADPSEQPEVLTGEQSLSLLGSALLGERGDSQNTCEWRAEKSPARLGSLPTLDRVFYCSSQTQYIRRIARVVRFHSEKISMNSIDSSPDIILGISTRRKWDEAFSFCL